SECYSHFKDPTVLIVGDIIKYVFVCKRFPSKDVKRARYDTSTSNLVNHASSCAPASGVSIIKKFTKGGDYPVGRFRLSLALWIAVRNRPHAILKDDELVEAFMSLQPNVHVPSDNTIARDIKLLVALTKPIVKERLAAHKGAIHGMLDGWTSPNVLSMVGFGIQYVVQNELKTHLLDMIPL
ncbi:hypothetical protein GGX14DRAFT_322203, partial [Mycena pura]